MRTTSQILCLLTILVIIVPLSIVILAKVNFARKAQTNTFIKLVYVPTTEQLADGMTKALPSLLSQSICLDHYLYGFEFEPHW